MRSLVFPSLALSLIALIGGCKTTHPNDLTIDEHQKAAEEQKKAAAEDAAHYDPNASVTRVTTPPGREPTFEEYNPTDDYKRAAEKHLRDAAAHEKAAAQLASFEDQACKPFKPAVRAACPLLGTLTAVEPISGGARAQLKNPASAEPFIAHIRCHVAFGDAHGESAVEGCPLYLKGLKVESTKDGWVTFRVQEKADTDKLLTELREHLNAG